MRNLILVPILLAGCGDPDVMPSAPSPFIPGFSPTAPGPGQIQVLTAPLPEIPAGKDITYCTYLDFSTEKELDVTSYLGFQSKAGHHSILYANTHARTPNTHECNDDDMYNVHYIGGGGTDATVSADKIPKGIVFRIPAHAQLMMVSHWINASTESVIGQAAYNITVQNPSTDVDPGDLFTVVKTDFELPPGPGATRAECVLQQDFKFFMIGGHAHEHAVHIKLGVTPMGGTPSTIYDVKWTKDLVFNTPLNQYEKATAFQMHKGDLFTVDCEYSNETGAPIKFPKEMCVGYGYFFPATQEIDCVDGAWPQPQ